MTEVSLHTRIHGEPQEDHVLTQDSCLVQPDAVISGTYTDCAQHHLPMSGYSDVDMVCTTSNERTADSTSKIPNELSSQNQEHASVEMSQSSPATGRNVLDLLTNIDNDDDMTTMLHHRHSDKENGSPQGLRNSKSEFRRRRQRLHINRGLASLTDIPNVTDNRYMILNLPEEEAARIEPPIKPIRRRNIAPSHRTRGLGENGAYTPELSHTEWNQPTMNHNPRSNTYVNHTAQPYSSNNSDYDNQYMMYDDIDQVENLEELENIPAFDEIPYALLLTGALDDVTIRKAKQKQHQRNALEDIRKVAEIQHNMRKGTSTNKNRVPKRTASQDKQPSMQTDLHSRSPYQSANELMKTIEDMTQQPSPKTKPLHKSAYEVLKAAGKLTQQLPQSTQPGHVNDTYMRQLEHNDPLMQQTYDASLLSAEISLDESIQHFDAACQDMQPKHTNTPVKTGTGEEHLGRDVSLQSGDHSLAQSTDSLGTSVKSGDLQGSADDHTKSFKSPLERSQELTETVNAKQPDEETTHQVLVHHSCDTVSNVTDEHPDYTKVRPLPMGEHSFIATENTSRKSETNDDHSSFRAHSESRTDAEVMVDNEMMTARSPVEESKDTFPLPVDETAGSNSLKDFKATTKEETVTAIESSPVSHTNIAFRFGSNLLLFTLESSTDTESSVGSSVVSNEVDMTKLSAKPEQSRVENKQRKDTDEFIRMKRLERYAVETPNTEQQNVVPSSSQTKKDDHRTKAVHSYGTNKKPLKSKVFKTPLFELSDEPLENDKAQISVVDGQTNADQDSVKTKDPSAMKYLQNDSSVPKEEASNSKRPSTDKANPSTMIISDRQVTSRSKPDKNNDVESDNANQSTGSITTKFMEENPTGHRRRLHDKDNHELSRQKKPATMRLLERMKGKHQVRRSNREIAKNTLATLLPVLMGIPPQSDTHNEPKKKESKVINKNATPAKVNKNNTLTSGEGTLDETRTHEDKRDLNFSMTVSNENTKIVPEVKIMSGAKLRHEAFRILKQNQSGNQPKCTACGRSECEGQNIKEMKTMVRMAKENGYEIRDVSPDGNCMFAAVIDQLSMYGDSRFNSKSLRDAAVSWLVEHPLSNDGTHYSNFVSCEWELYLQKMYAEGEWGDHVILGAVVEVVGHTIKIFHVRGDKSFWTVLQPSSVDVSNDGIHLVLGLVGEFHYTSLRPSDAATSYVPPLASGSGVTDEANMKNVELEGGETIDMFRDDYIDPVSEFPVAHFSFLLKIVVPMRYLDSAARCSSESVDTMRTHYSEGKYQLYGPAAEGVYHPYIFASIDYHGDTNAMVEAMILATIASNTLGVSDIEEWRPGFGGLKNFLGMNLPGNGIPMPIGASYLHSGNASYLWTNVKGMSFKSWPDSAKSWISRVRLENWPSVDVVNSIVADGYTVATFCHPTSSDPLNECQILFVSAEHKLFREATSKYQRYCFIMFIALCVQTMHDNKSISYRHFKNIFFYACERIPSEYWQTHVGSCVLYMIDTLMRCIKARTLPNYFIDTYNMIDHLTDSEIRDLDERLVLLRSQPELFLKNTNANLERYKLIDSLIERVAKDIPQFSFYPDLKMASLSVFVPASIDLAQGYIQMQLYEIGYELLSNAFQERLSVSTCDEMVPYQMFITAAVSGLDLESQVWFCAYTDKQLEGQLSKSLIRETCGDLVLTTIQSILPPDVCGSFANTEVPKQYETTPCLFCTAFVRFLYNIQKMSDVLSVLQYCHRVFKDTRQQRGGYGHNATQFDEDFNEHNMFQIYTAMFRVNQQQGQLQAFKSVLPEVKFVCQKIGTRWAFDCLKHIYKSLGDEANMAVAEQTYEQLPEDQNDAHFINLFHFWPRRY